MQFELTREFLEHLQDAISSDSKETVLENVQELHAADISNVLESVSEEEAKYILKLLPVETQADVISEFDDDDRPRFVKRVYSPKRMAQLLEYVDSDDAADILNEQSAQFREESLAAVEDRDRAKDLEDLLRFDEDTAGGLMAKELISVNINWNVQRCIEEIRSQRDEVEKIYTTYVVDDEEKLQGILSLKKLLLASDNARVEDLFERDVIAVNTYDVEEDVVARLQKYDLTALPVVNIANKLVGRITFDDVMDVIQDTVEQERQLMSGISEPVEKKDNVFTLVRARLPWLFVGMTGGLVGAQLIGFFAEELAIVPAMAFFIPLIMATGGNVGIQSSTLVVQSLANKDEVDESLFKDLWKAFAVAIINGVLIAGVVFMANYFLGASFELSMVVAFALFSVVILASLFGTITPLILENMNVNPALASGPFITTLNDILGIAVYFAIAKMLLM